MHVCIHVLQLSIKPGTSIVSKLAVINNSTD